MRLCISKTIEERAEVKAERLSFDNKDELWRADVISLNRKKVIVFINEQSSLTFFYFRPSERDFRHLSDVFKSVLSENFKALGIDYPASCDITVSKGESKALFAKARERLLLFEEYLADDDSFLIYPAFMINSRKVRGESPVESYLASHGLKRKDYSFMLKIRREDGRETSLLIPPYFTLLSLKKCIDIIYSRSSEGRYDFTSYSNDDRYAMLEYFYRPEIFRALDKELDPSLKRKGCHYALAKSTMLSTIAKEYGNIVYRSDFINPERFFISFDSTMENISLDHPMILSIKWADDDNLNALLRDITS